MSTPTPPPVVNAPDRLPRLRDRLNPNLRRGQTYRRVTPPLGWPISPRAVVVHPANRHGWVVLNVYPRQIIGIGVRLPDDNRGRHRSLSLLWTKPARWWSK